MSDDFRVWYRNYVTQCAHGAHPAGTACEAARDWRRDLVLLKFGEEIVELPGHKWRLSTERDIQTGLICAEEDERVFRILAELAEPEEVSPHYSGLLAKDPEVV